MKIQKNSFRFLRTPCKILSNGNSEYRECYKIATYVLQKNYTDIVSTALILLLQKLTKNFVGRLSFKFYQPCSNSSWFCNSNKHVFKKTYQRRINKITEEKTLHTKNMRCDLRKSKIIYDDFCPTSNKTFTFVERKTKIGL